MLTTAWLLVALVLLSVWFYGDFEKPRGPATYVFALFATVVGSFLLSLPLVALALLVRFILGW